MYETYISSPNKQFWFSIQPLSKPLDPNFNIEKYWLGRYDNELIVKVNEHDGKPLITIPKLMAYSQL